MIYAEFKPHALLVPYIECYWKADAERPPFREEESLIPDGTIELMFNFGDDYVQVRNGERVAVKGSHIIGIRKKTLRISQSSSQHIFSVRFRVGGTYPFFGVPMHLFANRFWDMHDLLGGAYRELEEQLYEADDDTRIRLADRYFLAKLFGRDSRISLAATCSNWMLEHPHLSIADACRAFGTNYKTLERHFSTVIGLTPNELLKIRRFNKVILEMYNCRNKTLTAAAYASGYYDQSHFIREFKQLSGLTPRGFLKEQFTIVKVIQPALADRLSKSYNL